MDVIFETPTGTQFAIEIGFFDTVLEIKEKIQKYQGFPIATQTLVFKGKTMSDELNTEHYDILQGSRIHLMVESESNKPVKVEEPMKVHVLVKIWVSKKQFSMEVDVMDTVMHVKERIHEQEGIPMSRFMLFVGNVELQDHRTLAEYGVSDHSEISVVIRPFPPAISPAMSKKLKVMVKPMCGQKKIPMEVNSADNVSELRKEVERLHSQLHFHLPTQGYFFIYKRNVMDEENTFRWHEVRQGDTIEIFNGSISGGS